MSLSRLRRLVRASHVDITKGFPRTPYLRTNTSARTAELPEAVGAALRIHKGASVKTVQLALGHPKPTVTLNTCVGEWPEAPEKTRALVDAALGRVPRMCPPRSSKRWKPSPEP